MLPDPTQAPRGVVVLAHGLNTTPRVMDDVADVLRHHGYDCAHVDLRATGPPGRDPDAVLARWCRAYDDTWDALHARHPGTAVSAVGFSLGAVVPLLRAATGQRPLRRLVMWAPPLALARGAAPVRALAPAHRLGWRLLSATPRDVRAERSTALVDYAALLRLRTRLDRASDDALARTPALVLLDGGDPLVSASGVRAWVGRRDLPGWQTEVIQGRPRVPVAHRHLVVSRRSLGEAAWQRATTQMLAHLRA